MTTMPPNVIVCRHCKKAVDPADLRWRPRYGGYDFSAWGKTHAIAELIEGALDENRKRILVRRRVLVCLVGLNRWH